MSDAEVTPQEIIAFWKAAGPDKWWAHDEAFDAEITALFSAAQNLAATGQLDAWKETAEGSLALILLLDQFSRNIYRGSYIAFQSDAWARHAANNAIAWNFDAEFDADLRVFFYLPYMHSERLSDQDYCLEVFRANAPDFVKWAEDHREIIARFGRFPHRNQALGRETTPEEQAFLDQDGFTG